jgi:hypothetical protein
MPAALAPGFHLGGNYPVGVLFVGCVLFIGIAALSRQNDRPYSASVFYLELGTLASVGLGVLGITRLDLITNHLVFEHVTEFALVIAVFGAGLAVERQISRRSKRVIAALLLVVMPLTIAGDHRVWRGRDGVAVRGRAAAGRDPRADRPRPRR